MLVLHILTQVFANVGYNTDVHHLHDADCNFFFKSARYRKMLIWLINIPHGVLRGACEFNSALFIHVAISFRIIWSIFFCNIFYFNQCLLNHLRNGMAPAVRFCKTRHSVIGSELSFDVP